MSIEYFEAMDTMLVDYIEWINYEMDLSESNPWE